MSSTVEASVLMGKNYSDNVRSIKKYKGKSHLKQMFEISEQLRLEQSDEIFGVSHICWESSPWKQLSLVNDEEVIRLSHAKVYVFSDSVLYLGKMSENPQSNTVWKDKLTWFKSSSQYRTLMGEPEQFQGRIIFMSMFNEIIWGYEDNETECIANSTLVSEKKRFPAGHWSFLGLGSETKWYSTCNERPQGEWDRVAELMMIKFRESGHPVFRATSPLSRSRKAQKQREWKIIFITSVPMEIRLKLFFAQLCLLISSASTEQSQTCVKNTVAVEQEQGDLLRQSNLIHFSRQQTY